MGMNCFYIRDGYHEFIAVNLSCRSLLNRSQTVAEEEEEESENS